MSHELALQKALIAHLGGDAALTALLGEPLHLTDLLLNWYMLVLRAWVQMTPIDLISLPALAASAQLLLAMLILCVLFAPARKLRFTAAVLVPLQRLDDLVGRDRYVLALTGDHGVAEIPEQVGTGRTTSREVGAAVDAALQPIFGPGKYVAHAAYTDIYFAPGVYERVRASREAMDAVLRAVRALLRGHRQPEQQGEQDDRGQGALSGAARQWRPGRLGRT